MDSGNDYVIQVKRNQRKLFQGIQEIITKEEVLDQVEKTEVNKGRKERRMIRLFKNNGQSIPVGWEKVNRIIEITNEGKREGRAYKRKHFYISSLQGNSAFEFGVKIRSHWSIENNLHRVKDVIQHEDDCLIQEKRITSNLSLFKSVTISVFRINGFHSIKKALERYRNRIEDCALLIGIKPILK